MTDAALHALARHAGLVVEWRDYAGKPHRVSTESLRRILTALDLPCDTDEDIAHSERQLAPAGLPPVVTATVGEPTQLPKLAQSALDNAQVTCEDGSVLDLKLRRTPRGAELPAIATSGYHRLEIGSQRATLAVAPARCRTVADISPDAPLWGLAVQAYGLRRPGDCGIGDMGGLIALAGKAAALRADALALSPMHALFAANPNLFSPYAPSSRLFYNPLHADPRLVFGEARVRKAAAEATGEAAAELERLGLIDWPKSAHAKLALFHRLYEDFHSSDLGNANATGLAVDFREFRKSGGTLLENHARFEALHAARLAANPSSWDWHQWPETLRDPHSEDVKRFAAENEREVTFHCFLQWLADASLASAQRAARQAGMRVGLIADLAVGMSGAGSHAWTSQKEILSGLEIGAPPDLYNQKGQNWGLTTFSPRALSAGGFSAFIGTMRACLRHAGGARIDHVMSLLRLWVVPRGADPHEGSYLSYPIDDLLRLTALESARHGAVVIGEDLGTVPPGFRDRLDEKGIYGMRVLWFERERSRFTPPQRWSPAAAAMTSTHDLPTVAGWWSGKDIDTRQHLDLLRDPSAERANRDQDRKMLWRAFRRAGAAAGDMPPPEQPQPVTAAAVKFLGDTPCELTLLPLEDALGVQEQPNLPGTIDQHPNWRRRYAGEAKDLLDPPTVRQRLAPLIRRGEA